MTSLPLQRATHYLSGEPIRSGDRVELAGSPGVIEFVLGDDCPPDLAWYAEQFGQGFMVVTQRWRRTFMKESDEDLEFLGRAE
jgi:hypothetical protein